MPLSDISIWRKTAQMMRRRCGKMDLELIPVDLKETLSEVQDMFSTQMEEKDITFIVDYSQIRDSHILCDKNRLNRVLLNLLSNAYKFTPEGGVVSVNAWQIGDGKDRYGNYELRVKDSGIGMTKEFAAKVYEATEAIRALDDEGLSNIPIVAMTANAFSEDVKKALDAGMNGHIAKPINVNTMKATLSHVILRRQGT